jgi:hypothetical protein
MRARMAYCGPRGIPLSRFLNWPVDDQAAALWWMAEDRLRCSRCGTAEWEWEEQLDAYAAEPRTCPGCNAIGLEAKVWEKTAETTPGMYIRLKPTGGQDGAN